MTLPHTRRKGRLFRGLCAAVAAISMHLLVLFIWGRFRVAPSRPPAPQVLPITGEAARMALDRSRLARVKFERQAKEKKRATEPRPIGPVVEIDQTTTPSKTEPRFAAEHDASTDHETRARVRARAFKPKALPTPASPASKNASPPLRKAPSTEELPNQKTPGQDNSTPKTDKKSPQEKPRLKFGPTAAPEKAMAVSGPLHAPQNLTQPSALPTENPARSLSLEDLIPSRQALTELGGGAAPDALNDMDVGDETRLNAAQYRYAGFFNRIKRSVSGHWRAMEEHTRRDPSGRLYGVASRQTVLAVVLDESGTLVEARVSQSSGIDFLDAAAVRAFREGQPFINPPKALLDQTKKVRFNFLFQLSFDGRYIY